MAREDLKSYRPGPADGSDTEGSDTDTGEDTYTALTPLHQQRMPHKFERTNAFHSRVPGSYNYAKHSDGSSSSSQDDPVRRAYEARNGNGNGNGRGLLREQGRLRGVGISHEDDEASRDTGFKYPLQARRARAERANAMIKVLGAGKHASDDDKGATASKRLRPDDLRDDDIPRPRHGRKVTFSLDSDYDSDEREQRRRKPKKPTRGRVWREPSPEKMITEMYKDLSPSKKAKVLATIREEEKANKKKKNVFDDDNGQSGGPGPATMEYRQRNAVQAAYEGLQLVKISEENEGVAGDVKKCGDAIEKLEGKLAEMSTPRGTSESLEAALSWVDPLMNKLDGQEMCELIKVWRKSEANVQGKMETAIADAQHDAKELMAMVNAENSKLHIALKARKELIADSHEDMNDILAPRRKEMSEVLAEREQQEAELRKKADNLPDGEELDLRIRQAALKCAQR